MSFCLDSQYVFVKQKSLSAYYGKWLKGYKYKLDTDPILKEFTENYEHTYL